MPIKYVPFIPEPVEGQAVLGNFNRILKYKGADDVSMTLQRGMPLYEMEKQETVGENADGNMVIRGECVSACAYLKEQGIQVDLVYIDPPFASGADYAKKVYIRRNPKVAEAIAQAEQELDVDELKAFEEKMYGDVWDKEKYLNWMYENLKAIQSVMSETASIYVHLDWHMVHYVKILMDEIFGEDNFINELIWRRKQSVSWASKQFGITNDTILWYGYNADEYIFNPEYSIDDENTKNYLEKRFVYDDNDGRGKYKNSLLTWNEFPQFKNDEMGYLLNDCDMSVLFGINSTYEYFAYSESERNRASNYTPRPYGLPGYIPNYSDDFIEELNDVFCYSIYSHDDNYIVKLKVDYIKHNTTVAFPSILFVKDKILEIPYKITSINNPDVVEGVLNVRDSNV